MNPNRGLPGETPLADVSGLLQKHIKTVSQLNQAEMENVAGALVKYLARRPTARMAPFTRRWMLGLHREMFGRVWFWAGRVRRTELNIGVPAYRVETALEDLARDAETWKEGGGDAMEQAALLHHRSVVIHPFLNGNGRWSRLLAQIWQKQRLGYCTEWPENEIAEGVTAVRPEYVEALKQADAGNYMPLIELQGRYTHPAR